MFVENGGGLLVRGDGDHNARINTLLEPFRIQMEGRPIAAFNVSELPENSWITAFSTHSASGNSSSAWFNWGTDLEILHPVWSVLMTPENVWHGENRNQTADDSEELGPLWLAQLENSAVGVSLYTVITMWGIIMTIRTISCNYR